MEALNFLKFWKPILTPTPTTSTKLPNLVVEIIDEEEEDSFFELELTVPDFDTKRNNNNNNHDHHNNPEENTHKENKQLESNKEQHKNSANITCNSDVKASKPKVSLSPNDHFSKRKIIPIEPTFKPQSPISLLKSAPRFRVLSFKKSKSATTRKTGKTEETEFNRENTESKFFTVKFKLEKASTPSMLSRDNSFKSIASNSQKHNKTEETLPDNSSKRFSKDVIQKYLKLIKPLYVKVSKRNNGKVNFYGELSPVSPAMSPSMAPVGLPGKEKQGNIPAGIRVACKHLGKSKSASAAIGVASPGRRDDSLLLQHDGIQSAILHCKRSFNSSDSSSLSIDSARNSNEEVNGVGI